MRASYHTAGFFASILKGGVVEIGSSASGCGSPVFAGPLESPEGAAVNSQGRKPLEASPNVSEAPEGRQ